MQTEFPTTLLTQAYVPILPKHIWEPREKTEGDKLSQVIDTEPMGSGPYKLLNYAPERIALQRDDNYWGKGVRGKLPAPKKIVHPIFKDNTGGDLKLESGEIDASQQFTAQIWKMWEDKGKPVLKREPGLHRVVWDLRHDPAKPIVGASIKPDCPSNSKPSAT